MVGRGKHARRLGIAALMAVGVLAFSTACRPAQPPGAVPADPTGYVDVVTGGRGEVRVQGWASQWDLFVDGAWRDQGPVQITLFMNGQWVDGTFPADKPRSDVDAALVSQLLWQIRQPNMAYGFDITVPAPRGDVSICVGAINQNLDVAPYGDHVVLGCRTVTVS